MAVNKDTGNKILRYPCRKVRVGTIATQLVYHSVVGRCYAGQPKVERAKMAFHYRPLPSFHSRNPPYLSCSHGSAIV